MGFLKLVLVVGAFITMCIVDNMSKHAHLRQLPLRG
jgi:hypothetical protein